MGRKVISMMDFIKESLLKIVHFLAGARFFVINKTIGLFSFRKHNTRFLPDSRKAVVIFSCDFELAWGHQFSKKVNRDIQVLRAIAKAERENAKSLVNLCEEYEIPLTWAIVGHLFLDVCKKNESIAHADLGRISYFENEHWRYSSGDWFDLDPCCSRESAPEWYAPDLIKTITSSSVGHEIGCHTFSHINCCERYCPEAVMRAELRKSKECALRENIDLKSLVFPGNIIGNLRVLREEGFNSYRACQNLLSLPAKDCYGLWRIPSTSGIGLSPYINSIGYYKDRYKAMVKRAIHYNRLCHFWFHPSTKKEFLFEVLKDLFEYLNLERKKLYITTMGGYVKFLESA